MIGLIYKDLLVMRKPLRTYLLLLLFYLFLGVVNFYNLFFVLAVSQCLLILPLSAFSYDEHAKWDRCAACLPVTRRQLVTARCGIVLLLALCTTAFGAAVCTMFSLTGRSPAAAPIAMMLASLGAGLLIVDIMLPLNYKLGPKRARPCLFSIMLLPMIGLFIVNRLGLLNDLTLSRLDQPGATPLGLIALLPLAALAGLGIAWLISIHIMERKIF